MRRALPVLASALLGGCSFTPHYARPELPVPPSWPVGDAYLAQTEAKLPTITYRDVFKDVRLQAIVGQALVNNRDLRTMKTDIDHVLRLKDRVPEECVLVAESGIRSRADVERLEAAGIGAMLVGESLLASPDPGVAAGRLLGRG